MAEVTLQTLKNDAKLFTIAFEFSKKEHNSECILFYYDKVDTKTIYEKYVAKNAPVEVNLSGEVAEPMHALAAKNDWQSSEWKGCLESARLEIARLWNKDTARRFVETKEYKAYRAAAAPGKAAAAALTAQKVATAAVAAQPTSLAPAKVVSAAAQAASAAAPKAKEMPIAEPIKADPKKAAKILGITNAKSIALLTKANDLNFKGDKNAALAVFRELVANEDMKMTPEAFMKDFQKMLAKNQKLNKV